MLFVWVIFAGCSNESSATEDITVLTMTVEPDNLNLNNMPSYLSITIKNTSNMKWTGFHHYYSIDYYDGDSWITIYSVSVLGSGEITIGAGEIFDMSGFPLYWLDGVGLTSGRYRFRAGTEWESNINDQELAIVYAEFVITK